MSLKLKAPHSPAKRPKPEADEGETLVQKTSHAVIQFMRDHRLRVGDFLPSEAEVATSLNVSRTVVRESFGALAAMRIIDVGSGRRAKVGRVDHSAWSLAVDHAVHTNQISLHQVWDVRRTVEVRAVELAANRRTDDEARAMVAHAGAMRKSMANRPEMVRHDIALHALIAQASRNALLHTIISSFGTVVMQTGTAVEQPNPDHLELMTTLHQRLASAIADRDAAAAIGAMTDHFYTSLRGLADAGFT